jgi:hypothetical protein
MRTSPFHESRSRLLPEGRRWGFGAHSVVPYLAKALEARPAEEGSVADSIRNPVFPHMETALRALHSRD